MADRLRFHLVSPEAELFAGDVDQVVVPGALGDFGVLPGHAPFMSTIRPGAITIMDGETRRRVFIDGGFADVTAEGLTILAEFAVDVADINAETVASDLSHAEKALANADDATERAGAQAAIRRAQAMTTALTPDPVYG